MNGNSKKTINTNDASALLNRLGKTSFPDIEGLSFKTDFALAEGEKASLFDVIRLNDNEAALIALETSGPAVAAAYATASAKLSFIHHFKTGRKASDVMKSVNREIRQVIGSDVFFYAFAAIIDLRTNTLRYSNAGLDSVSLIRGSDKLPLKANGGHLAIFAEWSYEEKRLQLKKGDVVSVDIGAKFFCTISAPPRKPALLELTKMTDSEQLHITTIHDFDQMKQLIRDLMNEADMVGYPIKFQKNFRLVLIELLTNAIIHGNKYDTGKKVIVLHEVNQQNISIGVIDEGQGYNPASLPDPLAPENINKPNGRGIFLIKHYAEHFAVLGRGNITTVRFARSKAQ
ncbi:MAG: ATP-binding protein [Fibrobacteres bacterium]|nr:ATP-binding protein [Fibrobacterota bacterium]